jgi:hypothetical protein
MGTRETHCVIVPGAAGGIGGAVDFGRSEFAGKGSGVQEQFGAAEAARLFDDRAKRTVRLPYFPTHWAFCAGAEVGDEGLRGRLVSLFAA